MRVKGVSYIRIVEVRMEGVLGVYCLVVER